MQHTDRSTQSPRVHFPARSTTMTGGAILVSIPVPPAFRLLPCDEKDRILERAFSRALDHARTIIVNTEP